MADRGKKKLISKKDIAKSSKIKTTKKPKLSAQQKMFCRLYVDCNNLADAWLKARYKCKSRDVARNNARELIRTNPYAEQYIAYLRQKLEEKCDKTAEDAIRELTKLGFSNIQDYITDDNEVVDLSKIPREDAAAIESIQVDVRHDSDDSEGYTEKVKLKCHNKESALKEFLNRVQGLPKQRMEVTGVVGTRELSEAELREFIQDKRVPCEDAIAQ
jgi:phage terminase small subunit